MHYRTVLRHRATDPVFREAYDLADAQTVPRLRAWLAEAREEERRRLADVSPALLQPWNERAGGSAAAGAADRPSSAKRRKTGAPGRIRTCDPKLRRLVLYPTELRARAEAALALFERAEQR